MHANQGFIDICDPDLTNDLAQDARIIDEVFFQIVDTLEYQFIDDFF